MLYKTSANAHYWSTVIDVLSCIRCYKGTLNDSDRYRLRYIEFPEAVQNAHEAYQSCGISRAVPFGFSGEVSGSELDRYFVSMLNEYQRLDTRYRQALENFGLESTAIPLYLL